MTEILRGADESSRPTKARALLVGERTPQAMTSVQECDARLAICRGLAEYLSDVSYSAFGGRDVRFKHVNEEFAEPEEQAKYPACRIGLKGAGVYEGRSLTPALVQTDRLPQPDGRYFVVPCDFVADLAVEVWANDPEERSALISALELAFMPQPFQYGFDLQLPYYFGQRASYFAVDLTIEDEGDASMKRLRNATFTVTARVPIITLFSFPDAKPSFDLRSIGDGPDVLVNLVVT